MSIAIFEFLLFPVSLCRRGGGQELDYVLLGARIREKRIERGWVIADLADRAGITEDFVGKIERATDKPSLETVATIANALQIGVDYLLGADIDVLDELLCSEINEMLKEMKPRQKKQFIVFLKNNQPFFANLRLALDEYE